MVNDMDLQNKILGSLLGAAIGDAMGAATELRPKTLIKERFGGEVRDIITPPDDTFSRGAPAGSVTDDFSLIYHTVGAILANGGVIDETAAKNAVLSWSEDEVFFDRYAGPTTRAAVERLRGVQRDNPYAFICCDNAKASNGSAMKISPAGLFNPGNVEKAIADAITICRPTHNNNLSISGACAIAAAVSEALRDGTDLYRIVQAGLYAAKRADEITAGTCDVLAGPSVYKRIKLAVQIGLTADSPDEAATELADVVGSGLHISEAVPAVFGLIVACKGDALEAVISAVNIGSDTDTIATMTGAIMGAFCGSGAFPQRYQRLIETVNDYDLTELARRITETVSTLQQ